MISNSIKSLANLKKRKQESLESELAKLHTAKDSCLLQVEQLTLDIHANRQNKIDYKKSFYKQLPNSIMAKDCLKSLLIQTEAFDKDYQSIEETKQLTLSNLDLIKVKISQTKQEVKSLTIKQEKYSFLLSSYASV